MHTWNWRTGPCSTTAGHFKRSSVQRSLLSLHAIWCSSRWTCRPYNIQFVGKWHAYTLPPRPASVVCGWNGCHSHVPANHCCFLLTLIINSADIRIGFRTRELLRALQGDRTAVPFATTPTQSSPHFRKQYNGSKQHGISAWHLIRTRSVRHTSTR